MDKISNYNITTSFKDNILIYNTLTDSMVRFTYDEYTEVESLLKNLLEFQREYPTLYLELKKSGFLVEEDFDELNYIKLQNKKCIYANSEYHITINPTLNCNLACWYCSTEYAQATHKGGMSKQTLDNIKKHLELVIEKQKASSLHLDWFGGEPSMYFDEVIAPIASHAIQLTSKNEVKFTQHITTNATLLNEERINHMKELHFTSFQIPIDGNEEKHNQVKKTIANEGTYRQIINNINLIAEVIPNVHIIMRINYDKQTLKNIDEIISDISENSKKHIQVDFQKVWQIQPTAETGKLLNEAKEKFRLNGFYSPFWAYRPRKFYRCYSDKYHYYAINYDGKLYKCTAQNYGNDKVIGILQTDGEIKWNDKLLSKFYSQATFENEKCLKCNKLPICMGPCIAKNYESRRQNMNLPCMLEGLQYTLDNYIIEEAYLRNIL